MLLFLFFYLSLIPLTGMSDIVICSKLWVAICRTAIKALFSCFNLCLSVMFDSRSCWFTSISFLTIVIYVILYQAWHRYLYLILHVSIIISENVNIYIGWILKKQRISADHLYEKLINTMGATNGTRHVYRAKASEFTLYFLCDSCYSTVIFQYGVL
jgi:hypothetical protein